MLVVKTFILDALQIADKFHLSANLSEQIRNIIRDERVSVFTCQEHPAVAVGIKKQNAQGQGILTDNGGSL